MDTAYHDLINFWRNCPTEKPPYIAPPDEPMLSKSQISIFTSYNSYIENNIYGDNQDKSLHVGLLPIPYVGNLDNATVYILLLNPGLGPTDYYGEYKSNDFRQMHLQNLRQEKGLKFPFHFLNPKFSWHGGFDYWHKKLGDIAHQIHQIKKLSYLESLEFLSQRIVCLELIPYHSKSFGVSSLINKLPSSKIMKAYVKNFLFEKAEREEITIIVTRSARNWDISRRKNVIIYGTSEARSAHLSLNSSGGKAIAKQIGL